MIERTSLDRWILDKHGLDTSNRQAVRAYQLDRIRDLLGFARENSRLYGLLYQGLELPSSLQEFSYYPFTSARDLAERETDFLCVHPSEIARIVTLQTTGTTRLPKRVYFTREDIELTLDFFFHGMQTLCSAGDRALILFPWRTPDSVGALLKTALEKLGLTVFCSDPDRAEEIFSKTPIDVVCGPASWVIQAADLNPSYSVGAVLTSSEVLYGDMRSRLMSRWGALVFDHYGMTETGLGGAVECQAHAGMHIRENDLFFEVIDADGRLLHSGSEGELVVTTLTRKGMPFIRYRTGDRGVITEEVCPCGSSIPRIQWVRRIPVSF